MNQPLLDTEGKPLLEVIIEIGTRTPEPWRVFKGRSIADIPYAEWVELDFMVWRMQTCLERRAVLLRFLDSPWCQGERLLADIFPNSRSIVPVRKWALSQLRRNDLKLHPHDLSIAH